MIYFLLLIIFEFTDTLLKIHYIKEYWADFYRNISFWQIQGMLQFIFHFFSLTCLAPRALHIFLSLDRYLWLLELHPQMERCPEKKKSKNIFTSMEWKNLFHTIQKIICKLRTQLNAHFCGMTNYQSQSTLCYAKFK